MRKKIKVFGAAVDASDFPLSIQMKLAYLNQLAQNLGNKSNFIDPYEAFLMHSSILAEQKFLKIGKFPIDSWLTPKPKLEDFPLINQVNFSKFTNDGLQKPISDELKKYITTSVASVARTSNANIDISSIRSSTMASPLLRHFCSCY